MKHFKGSGTMNRKEGSGQPRSLTRENTDLIEELICPQEEAVQTHIQHLIKLLSNLESVVCQLEE